MTNTSTNLNDWTNKELKDEKHCLERAIFERRCFSVSDIKNLVNINRKLKERWYERTYGGRKCTLLKEQ